MECVNGVCDRRNEHLFCIDKMYNDIINILQAASMHSARSCSGVRKKIVIRWNFHVAQAHAASRLSFQCWALGGKPVAGHSYENIRSRRSKFKNKLKWCHQNEKNIKFNYKR